MITDQEIQDHCRIAIVTALPKECAAVRAMLSNERPLVMENDPNEYYVGTINSIINGFKHIVIVALLKKMGTSMASAATTNLIRSFPQLTDIIMAGIAYGCPNPAKPDKHVRLGDIVVSESVRQIDNVKIETKEIIHRGVPLIPSARLLGAVNRLETDVFSGMKPWENYIQYAASLEGAQRPSESTDVLYDAEELTKAIPHPSDPQRVTNQPKLHIGLIASANTLLKNGKIRDYLRDHLGVRAGEMEGSGLADAAWLHNKGFLVIRGICDYGDHTKVDQWQGYAAAVAAAYARAVIEKLPGPATSGGRITTNPRPTVRSPNTTQKINETRWIPQPAVVAETTKVFVGRTEELNSIHSILLGPSSKTGKRVCFLYGMPGVGKSYLAQHFIETNIQSFSGGYLKVTFAFDEQRNSADLFAEYVNALHLDPEQVTQWIHLKEKLQTAQLLLYFENVDNDKNASILGEIVRNLDGCPILVSGRLVGVGRTAGWTSILIPPFDETLSMQQLEREFRPPTDVEERIQMVRLVNSLGFLPLAIHLAAGHLHLGRTCDGFLRALSEKGLDVGPADPADPLALEDRARSIIRSTFELSIDHLKQLLTNDQIFNGLSGLGLAPLSGFGVSIGMAFSGLSESNFDELVFAAGRLSIIEINKNFGKERRWHIHPLLAELLRQHADKNLVFRRIATWFLSRFPERTSPAEQNTAWDEIDSERRTLELWLLQSTEMPECLFIHGVCQTYCRHRGPWLVWARFYEKCLSSCSDKKLRSTLLETLGELYLFAGRAEDALRVSQEKQRLDTEDGNQAGIAASLRVQAAVQDHRGNTPAALQILQQQVAPLYQTLGALQPLTVTYIQIVDYLLHLGQKTPAKAILTDILQSNIDSEMRLSAMTRMASIMMTEGDFLPARRLLEEELVPLALSTGNRAAAASALGQLAQVLQTFQQWDDALVVLSNQRSIYAMQDDSQGQAISVRSMAYVLQRQGKLEEAIDLVLHSVLPVFISSGNQGQLALTFGRIADILADDEQWQLALQCRRDRELPIYARERNLREYLLTRSKIAYCMWKLGDLEKSLEILINESIPSLERVDQRAWMLTKVNTAQILLERNKEGDRDLAKRYLDEAESELNRAGLPEAALIADIRAKNQL